jgi:hypothetical protein
VHPAKRSKGRGQDAFDRPDLRARFHPPRNFTHRLLRENPQLAAPLAVQFQNSEARLLQSHFEEGGQLFQNPVADVRLVVALLPEALALQDQRWHVIQSPSIEMPPIWLYEAWPPKNLSGTHGFDLQRSLVWNQDLKRDLARINQVEHLGVIALLPEIFPRLEITRLRDASQHPDCGRRQTWAKRMVAEAIF